ncbi:MAG: peptide chain release factor N(5)-glutamine methyltransferase [Gemmatimonadota bacterium]
MPDTIRLDDVLHSATGALAVAGLESPRREAIRLWEGMHAAPAGSAILDRGAQMDEEVVGRFEAGVRRRAAGEPLAYVTGWTGFRRLALHIDSRALIPRPETEGLVDLVLARIQEGTVVDVGTGSGCIALALASENPRLSVLAIDRSLDALALAAENRTLTGLPIAIMNADLCLSLDDSSARVLVSNPPYLTDAEYAALDDSVRKWEPRTALASGADGLEATTQLLRDGLRVVEPGGWLALEVDCRRAEAVAQGALHYGWTEATVHDDLFGRARYVLARRSETT